MVKAVGFFFEAVPAVRCIRGFAAALRRPQNPGMPLPSGLGPSKLLTVLLTSNVYLCALQ